MRFSLVFRLPLIVSCLVLTTAVLVYAGMEYRFSHVYRTEVRGRMRLLAGAIAHGTKNLVASPGAHRRVGPLVGGIIAGALREGEPVERCRIADGGGREVFLFEAGGTGGRGGERRRHAAETVTVDITAGEERIGVVELRYRTRNVFEAERTRQILAVGNTLSSLIRDHLLSRDYFQINDLVNKTIEEDPNVLYCIVLDRDGAVIHEERTAEYGQLLTAAVSRRAARVSRYRPVIIQPLDAGSRYVEASHVVEDGRERMGVVRVGYSMESLRGAVTSERRRLMLLILCMTGLSVGLAFAAARNMARPVGNLAVAVRAAAEKAPREMDFGEAEREMERITEAYERAAARLKSRSDELAGLANAFGELLHSLRRRIGELHQFYRKMSQAERLSALGQLSAGIAHEINNPLTVISTYVQMMRRRGGLDSELRDEFEIMNGEINKIAGKVKELLSFAQEKPAAFAPARLHDFLRETLRLVRHPLKKNGIELVEEYAAGEQAEVFIDGNQMRQVFLNLALNAIQAMEGGGKLTVRTEEAEGGERFAVRVEDTGRGISAADLPRVFDPFFTTKGEEGGTGLGLAIAYRVVQSHGGEIAVESAEGKGTRFSVYLPRVAGTKA
ncbi:MAG: ATP-binding protein [bacterium]